MAEEDIMIEDDAISLDDLADSSNPEDINTTGIVDYVYEKYNRAENYRENDEDRWLRAYRNYRGLYGPDVQFTEAEKSRVFVKTTKTKEIIFCIFLSSLGESPIAIASSSIIILSFSSAILFP